MTEARARRPLLAAVLTLLALIAIAAPARAAGSPNVSLSADSALQVLYGDDATVTLTAANPAGEPRGYNLSLRVELPPGVTFVPGSGPDGVPVRVVDDPGRQSVIFTNVSDLSANSSYDLSFDVAHDPGVLAVGSTFQVAASAYVNSDPRYVPQFDAAGQPVAASHTGDAAATQDVELVPFRVVREAPDNRLRGAHDFQYVTRLRIENNSVAPTSSISLTDFAPDGVEVLACGDADHTTGAAPEYPGSGPLNPGNAPALTDCEAPDEIATVNADPGGLGAGVWTRQTWSDLGSLAASGTRTIEFAAAIPIRRNTTTWTGTTPTPASGGQAANLDNNGGAETYDEQQLTGLTEMTGVFGGTTYGASDTQTTVAEDLTLSKTASSGTIAVGATTTWTLTASASEYRWVDDAVIVDTVPDGLCPLGATDYDTGSPECDPIAGSDPYDTVAQNADGTWTVTFDPLPRIAPGGSQSVALTTQTRARYHDGADVLSNDAWTNTADISGDDWIICTGGAGATDCPGDGKIDADEADGQPDTDTATERQVAASPTLEKEVASAGSADCLTATYTTGTAAGYGPGDRVCWRLRMTFPGGTPTGGVELTDFLPIGHHYDAGSFAPTGANTTLQTIDTSVDGLLTWDIGTAQIADEDAVFEGVLATIVDEQATPAFPGQLTQNLLKASTTNTPKTSFPLRADAGVEIEAPVVALDKSVADVNDAAPVGGATPRVVPNDVVTYRVRVGNGGERDAQDVEVWDELPAGITCTEVVDPGSGTCAAGVIKWTVAALAAGAHQDLEYDVRIPTTGAGQTFTNTAGVRTYASQTNLGGRVDYFPQDNIDPTVTTTNAAPADDAQSVATPLITPAKTRTTEIAATDNAAGEATIGEIVDYTVTFTVPEDTVLYGTPELTDPLTRQTLVAGSLVAKMNGSTTLPTGVAAAEVGNGIELTFPDDYVATADEQYTLTFSAQVEDAAANVRGAALGNTATLAYERSPGVAVSRPGSASTTIVEPSLSASKAADDADGIVDPGQQIGYTVTAANGSAGTVSTAHQVTIADTLPGGLILLDGEDGDPVADGDTVGPDGGVWDDGDRTITWTVTSLVPGASVDRRYWVRVPDPVVSQSQLTNSVRVTGSSLDAAHEAGGERTSAAGVAGYDDTADLTLDIIGMGLAKDMSPAAQTIGGEVTGTLTVTIPAGIELVDAYVTDLLPAGLVFTDYGDEVCTSGCTGAEVAPSTLPDEDAGSGRRLLGWWFGDVDSHTAARTLELTYSARVADTVDAADTLTNTARWHVNRTEQVTAAPSEIPDTADVDGTPVSDTTTVTEPALTLDKQVGGDADADDARTAEPGDELTYSIVVTNDGDHDAHDVAVADLPDTDLVAVTPTSNATLVTDGWTAADPDLAWTIPGPIEPDASVTLTYTAELAGSATLSPASVAANTADVPSYWGVPKAERDTNGFSYREYTDTAADTVTLDVDTPQVTVAKTATGGANAHVGHSYAWTITATNTATSATAYGVDVTDTLPVNWTYDAGSATIDGTPAEPVVTTDPAGDRLAWADVADLAAGEDVVIELEATPRLAAALDPGHGALQINRATVSGAREGGGAGGDADGSYSDASGQAATVLLVPQADLGVTKATTAPPVAGRDVAWRIQVVNYGPDGSPSVSLTDTLPAGVTVTGATASQGSCDTSGAPVIACSLGELAAGATATIDVTATVDDPAAAGASLTNTATASDPAIDDSDASNDAASATDTVLESARLTLDKERVDALVPTREARWRLTVANAGPSVARDVTIADDLPDGLRFASATGCTEAAGVVTCAVGDLDPGEVATRTVTTVVEATGGTVTNAAAAGSPTPAPDGGPSRADATAGGPVVRPDVTIGEVVEGSPVQGGTLAHTFMVGNAGGAATYAPTTVTATYAPGLVPMAAAGTGWRCRIAGATVTCTHAGTLEPGAAFAPIRVTSRVAAGAGTALGVSSRVGTDGDAVATNNDDHASVIAQAVPVAAPPSCADGGRLVVPRSRVWVGARTRIGGRVASAAGRVVPGQAVRVRRPGGRARTLTTDAHGRFAFTAHPSSAGRYVVSVRGCGLRTAVKVRRATSCRSLSVGPAGLQAGERARVRLRLRAGKRPLAGVRVRLTGAGVSRSVRTNRSGRARVRLRPERAGVVSVRASRAIRCTRRIGVVAQASARQLTG